MRKALLIPGAILIASFGMARAKQNAAQEKPKDSQAATDDYKISQADIDKKNPVNRIRDTVKLAVDTSSDVKKKNVQYNTSLSLPPGKFHLKFVVRENQSGRMGSFETDLNVPDLKSQPLKMSSIVLASQLQPAKKGATPSPLVRDGEEIIPNVTHVFSSAQHLRLYYEVYDPAHATAAQSTDANAAKTAAPKPPRPWDQM